LQYVFQFSQYTAFILLLLIPICIIVFWMHMHWQKNKIKKLGDYQLVQNMIIGSDAKWDRIKIVALLIGFALLIICLADPSSSGSKQLNSANSKEIVFALDLSNSMLATDVAPSRLDKAKQLINKLIDTNLQDKIGLVVFAGNAYIAVPITIDVESIKMNLASVNPNVLPTQGTNISEAIIRASECFNAKRDGGKAIVLITDGEDHEDGVSKAIEKCKNENIKIITVGVGSEEGAKIINAETQQAKLDADGKEIISKLNEKELQTIAKDGNGEYIHLQNLQDASTLINNQLSSLAGLIENNENTNILFHYFQWLLLPAILLIMFSLFYAPKQIEKWL
jgi:Ca-activated chloride channel homolog